VGWNARRAGATGAAIAVAVLVVLSVFAAMPAGAAATTTRGDDDAAIAALLQKELDAWRAEVHAPGAVAAIARREGAGVLGITTIAAASGLARKEPATPMAVDARMFSGSIGKVIVAAVALQLVEEGALELDAPLAHWLGEEKWYAQLPNGGAITLRQLMNHTSGLPEYFSQPGALAKLKSDPQHEWSPEERLAFVLGKPAPFAAGQGWSYADTNYIALGMVLERAGGGDFYDLARERVLEPLALGSTTPAVQSAIPGLCSGYTQPNRPFPFPAEVAVDGVYCANPQFEWTGGGFVTTPGDLARLAAVVFGSDDLLSNARRAEQTAGVAAQLTPGEQYGLGCTLRPDTNGGATGRAIGHSGWFPGYLSDMAWFEGAGVAVAVQVNTDQGVGLARLHQFLDRVALAVAPLVAAPAPAPVPVKKQ
jgi:D-alanyl-D-alanine carboxypeptidase